MATPLNITPLRAAKARDLFVHSAISRSFTQLNTALAHYVECERDIEHADSFDPAFLSWTVDAEHARTQVLWLVDRITGAGIERPEDLPLRRSARLLGALVESGSESAFTALHRLLGSHAHLFACLQHGAVATRTRQMLETCHGLLDALADLEEFNDAAAGPAGDPVMRAQLPLTAACAP
ncbi:MAG: hypothetical protein CML31_18075 [Rhizobiales bacterium]|nr:hypothetical protein [Hyphomicrobiales bacterium]|tara:strand:+ start:1599 stop:2138 length:540 start_codon:yes stop_codon:yes gene_type:complete